jgi:hypothetical protein
MLFNLNKRLNKNSFTDLIGRSGPECRDHLSPCQCKNGGVCIQQIAGLFRCRCQQGYGFE